MPNKGMNFLSIHLGSAYYFNEPNWQKSILKKEPLLNKNSWEVYLMGTAKTLSPSNELKPMMGIQTSYIRKFNHFHALLFSSEGLYNTHKKASEKNRGNEINAWDQSILLGYQLSIGATKSFQNSALSKRWMEHPRLWKWSNILSRPKKQPPRLRANYFP